jgi:hypothetical protein
MSFLSHWVAVEPVVTEVKGKFKIFVVGIGLGALGSTYFLHSHFEDKYDQKVQSLYESNISTISQTDSLYGVYAYER